MEELYGFTGSLNSMENFHDLLYKGCPHVSLAYILVLRGMSGIFLLAIF